MVSAQDDSPVERVVYLLGAGFGAPLGLPLTSNFLERSKDQFFQHPRRFSHFERVFSTIRDMSVAKNYYATDLFNIEDILSILEMKEQLGDDSARSEFLKYLRDVITFYTPNIDEPVLGQSWHINLFGSEPWGTYGVFVATLLRHAFTKTEDSAGAAVGYGASRRQPCGFEYAVVTLNYDLVLEQMASFINKRFRTDRAFSRKWLGDDKKPEGAYLAKLHGSVDTGPIIPPTWNKGLANDEIASQWKLAHRLLSRANHIRILGYSLPMADSYVRYLLRAAVIDAPHLKSIDVLTLDPDGTVKRRYDEFVLFKNYRFRSDKIETYLQHHRNQYGGWPQVAVFGLLDRAHEEMFAR